MGRMCFLTFSILLTMVLRYPTFSILIVSKPIAYHISIFLCQYHCPKQRKTLLRYIWNGKRTLSVIKFILHVVFNRKF